MSLFLIIFGLMTNTLLSVLVGLLGARRWIGFGWSFLLSLIFTPLVGLVCVLLSSPLTGYEPPKWGCLGTLMALVGGLMFMIFMVALLGLLIAL